MKLRSVHLCAAFCLLLSGTIGVAADPVPEPDIIFPVGPKEETPPAPKPKTDAVLKPGIQYIIQGKTPFTILDFPKGVVSVQYKTGPRDVSGKFWDGSGDDEDRTYPGPYIAVVKGINKGPSGKVDLSVVPDGYKLSKADFLAGKSTIAGRSIQVEGVGPLPPGPGPIPPDPVPDPSPVIVQQPLWGLVIVEETATAAEGRGLIMASGLLAKTLSDHSWKWRVVDKDVINQQGQVPADVAPYVADAKQKGTPRIYILSDKIKIVYAGPCPTGNNAAADIRALLNTYGK